MPAPRMPVRMPHGVSLLQADDIVRRYKKGASTAALGEMYGCSPYKILCVVRFMAGHEAIRPNPRDTTNFPGEHDPARPAFEQQVIEDYKAATSMSVERLAAKHGMGVRTFYNILDKHEVPRREPRKASRARREPAKYGEPLSDIECNVLEHLSYGHSATQIGARMGHSKDVILDHLRRIHDKLGARDRTHVIRLGFELKYLRADRPPGASADPDQAAQAEDVS